MVQMVRARRSVVPGPPGCGLGVRLITPPRENLLQNLQKLWKRPRPTESCNAGKEEEEEKEIIL
jgi:hypothetical protein